MDEGRVFDEDMCDLASGLSAFWERVGMKRRGWWREKEREREIERESKESSAFVVSGEVNRSEHGRGEYTAAEAGHVIEARHDHMSSWSTAMDKGLKPAAHRPYE
jgi:hypothetical protein